MGSASHTLFRKEKTMTKTAAEVEAEEFLATVRECFDEYGPKVTLAGVAMWLLDLIGDDEEDGDDGFGDSDS